MKRKFYLIQVDHEDFKYCVIDGEQNVDKELTKFMKFLSEGTCQHTFKSYSSYLLIFLSWYKNTFNEDPKKNDISTIRARIQNYLIEKYNVKCKKVNNLQVIYVDKIKISSINSLLSILKKYFSYIGRVDEDNPLKINVKKVFDQNVSRLPSMPQISGVMPDKKLYKAENFFVIANNIWIPKIIENENLNLKILKNIHNYGLNLREILIIKMLFETGARVSEICGLSLGDWYKYDLKNKASCFNKGSFKFRVKSVTWGDETTILLKKYFNTERKEIVGKSLDFYLKKIDREQLFEVPIFVSKFGNRFNENSFRDLFWGGFTSKLGIKLNIHQIRHFYVTTAMKLIDQEESEEKKIELKNGLIQYMNWKNGDEMLKVYNHYLSSVNYSEFHHKLINDFNCFEYDANNNLTRNDVIESNCKDYEVNNLVESLLRMGN